MEIPFTRYHRSRSLFALMLVAFALAAIGIATGTATLWAKKATDLARQPRSAKQEYALSRLAARTIPETPVTYLPAATLNRQVQSDFQNSPAMRQFEQKYGTGWQSLVDERSMSPTMLMGEGVPFIFQSAKASKAGPRQQVELARADSVADLEKTALQFIADNQSFLKVDPALLQFDPSASGALEASTGKYRVVFDVVYQGVPVLGSYVSMFISHGNMILYGAEHIAPINLSTTPTLSPEIAVIRLAQTLSLNSSDIELDHAAELFVDLVESPISKMAAAKTAFGENEPSAFYAGPPGQGYSAELVYRIQFHVPHDNRSLVALIDANNGGLVDLYDQNHYQTQSGSVDGAIYTRGPVVTPGYVNQGGARAPEFIVPFARLNVTNGGTTTSTNPAGIFPFNGLTPSGFSTTLSGFQDNVMEAGSSACPTPQGPATSSGNILFSAHTDDGRCSVNAGSPSAGNGQATHGAQNGWFHTNFAVTHSQKFLMGYNPAMTSFYNSSLNVLVNDSGCNAFWTVGSCSNGVPECIDMSVCSVASGENNQADEPDTMSHEYGHALDYHTKAGGATGDRGKDEGLADIDAWLNTHRTCLSPGDSFPPITQNQSFNGFPTGDGCFSASIPQEPQALQGTGVRDFGVFICHDDGSGACSPGTVGRIESNDQATACGAPSGSCRGSLGYECHCEGHTTSGSVIDLFKLLVNRYGTNQAWYMIERLYYLGLPGITGAYGSSGAASTYSNFLAVDDDDGNLTNGTPDADLIFQAFRAHGTEGTQVPQFRANCSTSPGAGSPSAPSNFTATAQAGGGILLQWSPVAGATGYLLYRTEASQPGHNYETDQIPSSYYGRTGVFLALINPSTRDSNPNSGTNLFPAAGAGTQSYLDQEVAPGYEYFYQIQAVVPSGSFSCLSSLSPNNVDLVANATAPAGGPTIFSMPANSGASESSPGQGPLSQAYGQITAGAPNQPAALANFGFTQNGILTTEAGVAASAPTTSARMFVEYSTSNGADSGVAVVNPTAGEITVNIQRTDSSGSQTVNCPSQMVPAHGHFALFASQLCPGITNPFLGTLTLSSPTAFASANLQLATNSHGEQLYNALPVAVPDSPPTGTHLYFSQFADGGGFSTEILLMNLTGTPITGTASFFDDNANAVTLNFGTLIGSVHTLPYNIPANGMVKFTTTGSAPGTPLQYGSVVVTTTSGALPEGAVIFSRYNAAGGLASQAGVLNSPVTRNARMYVEKSNSPLTRNTGVAMVNPNAAAATIQLNLINLDGTFTANNTITLGPNAHVKGFIDEAAIMGAASSTIPAEFEGVLTITSDEAIAPVTLRLTTNQRGEDLYSSLPVADLNNPPVGPLYLPQIANGQAGPGFFTTQIIAVNTGSVAGTVTVNFFGDSGSTAGIFF